ncbi:MAG: XdhC family protein [Anaerolineales bacterium]|nr:MAG: XdhC family protein [Anaerolineales bacterium]
MGLYQILADRTARGESVVLITVLQTQGSVPRRAGTKMLIFADGSCEGTIGGGEMESKVIAAGLESLRDGKPQRLHYEFREPEIGDVGVCGGEMEVFVEPIQPENRIIVIGAGHVGQAIAFLAAWLGFHVIVADDRPDFATPEKVPQAHAHYHCSIRELPDLVDITENAYLVLTTRGVPLDVEGLPSLLGTKAAYIGVIGSKRRWETTVATLVDSGVDPKAIAKVHSPIGLEIRAETPEEIAVSVMAEIIMQMRGGSGEGMGHQPRASMMEEK